MTFRLKSISDLNFGDVSMCILQQIKDKMIIEIHCVRRNENDICFLQDQTSFRKKLINIFGSYFSLHLCLPNLKYEFEDNRPVLDKKSYLDSNISN